MSKDYEGHDISDDFEVFPVGTRAAIEKLLEEAMSAYATILADADLCAENGQKAMAAIYSGTANRLYAASEELWEKLK